ncbi:hypothetical protein Tco_0620695 [Tanacetum coccineum]
MSSSIVTYTSVYTDSEPGRVAPPSLYYVPGPKHPPSLDYVPGLEHPPSPVEPLPVDALPTALSPGYVADSDPDEDPEEDPEEDHADYPADEGDGDDESSDDDDTNDKDEDASEDEDDEEEERLAPADSFDVPVVDHVPLAGGTKAFETDESAPTPRSPQTKVPFAQTRLRRAWKTVRLEPPMSPSMEARIAEHAAAPTPPSPPPSPLSPWSSPLPQIPSPPLPKRACFTAPASRLEVWESSAAGAARQPGPTIEADLRRDRVEETGYEITYTWDEIVEAMLEIAPITLEEVNQRVTELATTVRQETEEFQVRFEDAQDDRAFLRARVNTLFRDRRFHRHTMMLLDREATYARRAWTGSEDRSAAIESEVSTLIAQTSSLPTQLTIALGRIETLEARDLEP